MTDAAAPIGVRPILMVRSSDGEGLLVARLSTVGASSQSNRFVLRRLDLRPPWPQPPTGYFGYEAVAQALAVNGWRGCRIEILPVKDEGERRSRLLALRKLQAHLVRLAIDRARHSV